MPISAEQTELTDTYKVGLAWDDYTPAVEAQVCRDVIALQNDSRVKDLVVISASDRADRVLTALGVRRLPMLSLARDWVAYRTKPETQNYEIIPEHVDNDCIVDRNLFTTNIGPNIDGESRNGYALKPQGRPIPNQLNMHKPPPNAYPPMDPSFSLLHACLSNEKA